MKKEQTFVMLKPDVIRRNIIGEVIERIENVNLNIDDMKLLNAKKAIIEQHYAHLKSNEDVFNRVVNDMIKDKVVIMKISSDKLKYEELISIVRKLSGATNPLNALPGTIRGDFGNNIEENVIHSSDSIKSAQRELDLWENEF